MSDSKVENFTKLLLKHHGDACAHGGEPNGHHGCLSSHEKEIQLYKKPNVDKFDAIATLKNKGDDWVRQSEWTHAKNMYKKANTYLAYLIPNTKEEQEKYDEIEIKLNMNLALVNMNLKQYRKAIDKQLDFVLRRTPENMKAWYRKAKCLLLMFEFKECEAAFRQIFERFGDKDKEIMALYAQLNAEKQKYGKSKLRLDY